MTTKKPGDLLRPYQREALETLKEQYGMTPKKAQHTPGPWVVGHARRSSNFGDMVAFVRAGPVKVAKVWSGDSADKINGDKAEINAKHIVHCVNLHDELVEALDLAVFALEGIRPDLGAGATLTRLRAVLAKARGQ
jgi:hypothetical protein